MAAFNKDIVGQFLRALPTLYVCRVTVVDLWIQGPHYSKCSTVDHNTLLEFRPADGVEVPDTAGAFGGAEMGVNPRGYTLPPILFSKAPIDTTGEPKMQGALKGPLAVNSDSDTDSTEDEGDDDVHKLRKLSHAAVRGQQITVEISGDYPWQGGFEEVFAMEYSSETAPSHILEPLQVAYRAIETLSSYYQSTDLPQSCRWTSSGLPREQIEVRVVKSGRGVHLSYGFGSSTAKSTVNFPSRFRVQLIDGWSMSRRSGTSQRDNMICLGMFDWMRNRGEFVKKRTSQQEHARSQELGTTQSPCRRFHCARRHRQRSSKQPGHRRFKPC
jgi:hypothetical protein